MAEISNFPAARWYKGWYKMGRKMPGPSTHPESKNFWFRMAVPERLRGKIGKREIKLSLGTSDPAEAEDPPGAWRDMLRRNEPGFGNDAFFRENAGL